jgi:hypothetical protein
MKKGNQKHESTQYRSKSPVKHHFSPKFALPQGPEMGDNARLRPELRALLSLPLAAARHCAL